MSGITAGAPVMTFNTSNPQLPVITSDFLPILQDASNYELDELELTVKSVEDTQLALQFDATRDFDSGTLQFGAKARLREKVNDENAQIWAAEGFFLSDSLNTSRTSTYSFPNAFTPVAVLADVKTLFANREANGFELEEVDTAIEEVANDWTVEEDIYAAYGMYKYQGEAVTIVGGVRVEYTDFASNGFEVNLLEDEETLDVTEVAADKSYTDVLPSVNIRYDIGDDFIIRGAVAKSVVRPGFEAVASRLAIEVDEANAGNPELEPFSAWNIDGSFEYYPTDLSIVSAGFFYKKIDDFIFERVFEDVTFAGQEFSELTISENGDEATVLGLELNYQQAMNFLPSPFDGFLVNVNYTYVDSEATVGERDIALPKQSENLGGITLGYDKYDFDVRLAYKYRDTYIDELGLEDGGDRFTDAHARVDLTIKYQPTDSLTLYAEFSNLTDEPEYYYQGDESRLLQYDEYGKTSAFGIQFVY